MFRQGIWIRGRELTHVLEQPGREGVLEAVRATRHEHPVADRPGLGRWGLSVPFEDWLRLRDKYPDLASVDARIKSRAWLRFMASDESVPYRMRDRV